MPTDALNTKAAEVVARQAEGDGPSEASVDIDFEFLQHDPTDITIYLEKAGIERNPDMAYRWCNMDKRMLPKMQRLGWEAVGSGIVRGDVILCQMPKVRAEAYKAFVAKRAKERESAPMQRFEADAKRFTETGQFSTFSGNKSPRDGL